jgi:hypothetical protein
MRNPFGKTLFALSLFAVACAPLPDDLDDVAGESQEVQTKYFYDEHFAIVQEQTPAARATGSVETPIRNPDGSPQYVFSSINGNAVAYPVRGTCGVTFVAPHYAITASHCVRQENVNPAIHYVTVRNYDVTGASTVSLLAAGVVTGMFPNYQPYYGVPLGQVRGYTQMPYQCSVTSRCGFGKWNCPYFSKDVDLALLHCPSRPADAGWVPIASRDPQVGPVEMYWFHELLEMPVAPPPPGAPAELVDRYNHYTKYGVAENFHYLASTMTALLPLRSLPWSATSPRMRLGAHTDDTTRTDLFGCHGSSGSGVFQRTNNGGYELLGPAVNGGAFVGRTLCTDGDAHQPGTANVYYLKNSFVKTLESTYGTVFRNDRR